MNIILLYNLVNIILFPFYIILLLARLLKGKENFVSFKSRFGIYKTKPKSSQLIWIHAASVGESMIAINLVNELKKIYQEVEFLVTTGTLSSANIVNKWLPAGVYHEFTPIDNFFIVRRFYKYWQPKLGIFIESDIWPTLVSSSAKKCKLLLLNARLSDKSFNKWQKFPKIVLPTGRSANKPPPHPKGALAQLVEHLHGMQGVSGSNPLRSTTLGFNELHLRCMTLVTQSVSWPSKLFSVKVADDFF